MPFKATPFRDVTPSPLSPATPARALNATSFMNSPSIPRQNWARAVSWRPFATEAAPWLLGAGALLMLGVAPARADDTATPPDTSANAPVLLAQNDEAAGPQVSLLKPNYADVLRGTSQILVGIKPGRYAPATIELFVDDRSASPNGPTPFGAYPLPTLPSAIFNWPTQGYADGPHKLSVRVTDTQGFIAQSEALVFINNNKARNLTPPSLSWLNAPTNALRGLARLQLKSSGSFGVKYVIISMNSAEAPDVKPPLATWFTNVPPYAILLDTRKYADGLYVLHALGTDALGQEGEAPLLRIGILNSGLNTTPIQPFSPLSPLESDPPAPTQPAKSHNKMGTAPVVTPRFNDGTPKLSRAGDTTRGLRQGPLSDSGTVLSGTDAATGSATATPRVSSPSLHTRGTQQRATTATGSSPKTGAIEANGARVRPNRVRPNNARIGTRVGQNPHAATNVKGPRVKGPRPEIALSTAELANGLTTATRDWSRRATSAQSDASGAQAVRVPRVSSPQADARRMARNNNSQKQLAPPELAMPPQENANSANVVSAAPALSPAISAQADDGSRRAARTESNVPVGFVGRARPSAPRVGKRPLLHGQRVAETQNDHVAPPIPAANASTLSAPAVTMATGRRGELKPISKVPNVGAPTATREARSAAPSVSGRQARLFDLRPRPATPMSGAITVAPSPVAAKFPTSYRARKGETMQAIATRYGLPVELLASLNGVAAREPLSPGQVVRLAQPLVVSYGGKPVTSDVSSLMLGSTSVAPFRFLFQAQGGTMTYDPIKRQVIARNKDHAVTLTIGSATAQVDQQQVAMDLAAFLLSGRTMVPVRFFEKALNAQVDWNPTTGRLYVAMAR